MDLLSITYSKKLNELKFLQNWEIYICKQDVTCLCLQTNTMTWFTKYKHVINGVLKNILTTDKLVTKIYYFKSESTILFTNISYCKYIEFIIYV